MNHSTRNWPVSPLALESRRSRWIVAAARVAIALLLAVAVMAGAVREAQAGDVPNVAAAADLQFALSEIAQVFKRDTGRQIRLVFGSSGNFARQIPEGAPYELFFSADEGYALRLSASGQARDQGLLYGIGRVVLFVPHGSRLMADAELKDLGAALDEGRIKRFAIANPSHAPYGRAAQEVLQHAGLWDKLQGRLVAGENASQAAPFAATGSAEGGIIPLSLALAPALAAAGTYALLPAQWHKPLRQRVVLLKGAGETAQRFYAFVQTPAVRDILARYGFSVPAAASR